MATIKANRLRNRHSENSLDRSNRGFNEITYGNMALWSESHADVTLFNNSPESS